MVKENALSVCELPCVIKKCVDLLICQVLCEVNLFPSAKNSDVEKIIILAYDFTYRIFLNRSRGFYFLFSNILCGFYSRAASIQGRLLFFI